AKNADIDVRYLRQSAEKRNRTLPILSKSSHNTVSSAIILPYQAPFVKFFRANQKSIAFAFFLF
ncbi:MAG: hypothetical protein IJZ80_02435, partial [Clostridia bacterium]|nr:hypothetical protein [Clostridia bacterium]